MEMSPPESRRAVEPQQSAKVTPDAISRLWKYLRLASIVLGWIAWPMSAALGAWQSLPEPLQVLVAALGSFCILLPLLLTALGSPSSPQAS